MPRLPPPTSLPPEVAQELASYMSSTLFAPLSSNTSRLREEYEDTMVAQKDMVQDAQAQISDVIEPAAERLIPIAEELKDVYRQIELLETLVARTGESIRAMAGKVEMTELALRREERALNDGKPLTLWKEPEQTKVFRASEFVENGRLKEPGGVGSRPGTPMVSASS